ncbi:cephalotocin receptor 1-like [Diadema antillarum]|uniref:cephalotocin receptor 1-like n=1 Tax=Diadema antillarum TaxID=105358 RepID=UPI003A84F433
MENYRTTTMGDIDLPTAEVNMTTKPEDPPGPPYDQVARMISLSVVFSVGAIGNFIVYVWLYQHRKEKNRFQVYIISLTTSDVLVMFVILSEIIHELQGKVWYGSNAACKVYKLYTSIALMASSNMVVGISVDRFHSVIRALKRPLPETKVIGVAWALALLFSLPQLFVFRKNERSNKKSYCMTGFKQLPDWHKQLYVTYITFIAFIAPFVIICYTYLRILLRLWLGGGSSMFKNKSNWQRTSRWRTLKMTMVIISAYVLCNVPYFSMELLHSYVDTRSFNMVVYGVFAIFASCNSVVNPYVFLFFNVCKSRKGYEKAGTTQQTNIDASHMQAGPKIYRETRLSNGNDVSDSPAKDDPEKAQTVYR